MAAEKVLFAQTASNLSGVAYALSQSLIVLLMAVVTMDGQSNSEQLDELEQDFITYISSRIGAPNFNYDVDIEAVDAGVSALKSIFHNVRERLGIE